MGALTEDQSVNEVQISVVIPVYQGRETLRPLIDAIAPLTTANALSRGEVVQRG